MVEVSPPNARFPLGTVVIDGKSYPVFPDKDYHRQGWDLWRRTGGFDDNIALTLALTATGDATIAGLSADLDSVQRIVSDVRALISQGATIDLEGEVSALRGAVDALRSGLDSVISDNANSIIAEIVTSLQAAAQATASDETRQEITDLKAQLDALGTNIAALRGDTFGTEQLEEDKANKSVQAIAGTGLSGGGTLAADFTFNVADTAVTPATYGSSSEYVTFTVDQQGRITAASEGALSTSNITEGSNLYFTDARARSAISGTGAISYNSGTGAITLADTAVTPATYGSSSEYVTFTVDQQGRITAASEGSLSTTNITEGTNLYYTDVRARAALSGTGAISYNSGTGVINITTRTGWAAATGTATRTTFDTATVTLSALAEAVKALLDDLTVSNIIGA